MSLRNTPLYAESWNVAFRKKPQGTILEDRASVFTVVPNHFRFWAADPFVFEHEGKIYIFAELYDYVLRRGVIGVAEYRGDNRFSQWRVVLKESFHMSYPFVFRMGGEIYMIPETHRRKGLLLYRATKFPDQWELDKILREDVAWVDTTIIPDGDGFLGFAQSITNGETRDITIRLNSNLQLIREESCKHQDPVRQRPGGRMFRRNEEIIRITQDCVDDYGKALFFCFEETGERIRIAPDELCFSKSISIDGMHTYSATGTMEVIDIKTRRLNLLNLIFRIVKKINVAIENILKAGS